MSKFSLKTAIQRLQASPTPLVMGTAGLTLLLFAPLAWMTFKSYQSFNRIQQREFRLRQLSDQITHFDEVLTMSAHMHAATGESQWADRYKATEPKLDAVIQASIRLGQLTGYADKEAEKTDAANQQLVALEQRAFGLVAQGQPAAARQLLKSADYKRWKNQYMTGVTQRNQAIQAQLDQKIQGYLHHLRVAIGVSSLSFLLLLPAWILVLRVLQKYLRDLQQTQAALELSNQGLARNNQNLETIVTERSSALTAQNIELEKTLVALKTSQGQVLQNEKMAVMGEMVAGVAHEINNPIGFIAGNLQPAAEYVDDLMLLLNLYETKPSANDPDIVALSEEIDLEFVQADLPKLIDSMQLGIDRIQGISNSLRTLARTDPADKILFDLQAGIEGTVLILRHRLKATPQRHEITVVTEFQGDCALLGFPGQVNQVLMNILANAIDAIDEKPTLETATGEAASTQLADQITIVTTRLAETIRITIHDTGMGMLEAVQQQVFKNLFTTKPADKGTGLGLAIVQQIVVDNHGGTIELDSTPGEGTTFTIHLPIAEPAMTQ